MYLQTSATRMAALACVKNQPVCGVRHRLIAFAAAVLSGSMMAAAPALAQTDPTTQLESSSSLPEAPSAMVQDRPLVASTPAVTRVVVARADRVAPIYMKRIPAGWTAQPLTARDKMVLGERDLYSPVSMVRYLIMAGVSQVANGQPNFGTDKGAFGQRLGAIVLRDSSESAFTDIVFAPLLHEDPRYYVEGPQYNLLHRMFYAVTRPILTRTDSGRQTLNIAQLMGNASASALSYTYYPQSNQNFHDTAATFGGSLAGSALGDLASEFSAQLLEAMHLKRRD